MKDFTKQRKVIEFQIDDDVFRAVPVIPADVMIKFVQRFEDMDPESKKSSENIAALLETLETLLIPDSFKRFRARMGDADAAIDINQVNEVVEWVMGEYGMRPTQSSDPSSTGSSDQGSGTSSTGSTRDVVSISSASPQTGS